MRRRLAGGLLAGLSATLLVEYASEAISPRFAPVAHLRPVAARPADGLALALLLSAGGDR